MQDVPRILIEEHNENLRLEDCNDISNGIPSRIFQKCYRECSSLIFILDDLNSEFVQLTYKDYKKMPAKLLAAFKLYRHLLIMDRDKSKRDDK